MNPILSHHVMLPRDMPTITIHTMHSKWENHPVDQDKSTLQLRGIVIQSLFDCPNLWTNCK